MTMRGIRGANTIESDQPEQVLDATRELLEAICSANSGLQTADIAGTRSLR